MENNYVLEMKTVQISPMRTLMTALKDILLETNIIFREDGIRIVNMDKSHTILAHLFLPSDKNIGKIKSLGDKSFSLINLLDQLNFLFLLSLNEGYLPVIISILYIYLCDKSYIYYIYF